MRPTRLLAALTVCAASFIPVPTAAAVTAGCQPTASGYRCVYGPFEVEHGSNTFVDYTTPPPPAGYLTSGRATLVDGDGIAVPSHEVHLHHAVWANTAEPDTTCPDTSVIRERFFATGKEHTALTLPPGYGYYWSAQPPIGFPTSPPTWVMVAELDGEHRSETPTVYVQLDLGFQAVPNGTLEDVTPIWLDERNCSTDPVFDVHRSKRRRRHREHWAYTMPVGGEFVAMAGHLHDGGKKLVLRNRSTGGTVFVSKAIYGRKRRPWYLTGMTTFSGSPGLPIGAGETVDLVAVYDSTHRWDDVMGIMVGMLDPA